MTTRGYIGQVYELAPILRRMEDRGMPIDNDARLALGAEFERAQAELGAEIASLAPIESCRVHPKTGYVGVPPQVKPMIMAIEQPTYDNVTGVYRDLEGNRFKESGDDGEFYHYEQRSFSVPAEDAATGEPVSVPTTRWCRVFDFNPNSRPQVIAYMRAKGHKVPKSKEEDAEGNQKDTTAAKELTRLSLRTADMFYIKVRDYRGLTKMRGTYVDGFVPHADGCVHTTFSTGTAIGQLNSANPNIQNFPKLKPTKQLAQSMRAMVAAKPGKILTEWDLKSCHVLTLGYLAEDPDYIRLARLDMHSYVAGHMLGLWDGPTILKESDAELLARFKWLKSDPKRKQIRDDQAKHTILGIGNGLKGKGLFERYPEEFGTQTRAMRFYELVERLFPKVFKWQDDIQLRAHNERRLVTEFGHHRRFFEVKRWDAKKGAWGHGDQAEQAISFWLSNIAFGHIREAMKELERRGFNERYNFFNSIHDSFMFTFDEKLLDEHICDVHPVLVAPSKVLRNPRVAPDGLHIDVEASWGHDWAHMTEIPLSKVMAPVVESVV
jgi:hypothetical protein